MPFRMTLLALVLLLSGCSREPVQVAGPREPGPATTGYYCRMTLAEHKGPKGQILPKGWKDPLWFSSVRDALTYVEQDIVSERELAGFWVNDMGQGTWEKPAAGAWVSAKDAWYVIGSTKTSGMGGGEAVPFKERATAQTFAKSNGGQVADYASARKAMAEAQTAPDTQGGGT